MRGTLGKARTDADAMVVAAKWKRNLGRGAEVHGTRSLLMLDVACAGVPVACTVLVILIMISLNSETAVHPYSENDRCCCKSSSEFIFSQSSDHAAPVLES